MLNSVAHSPDADCDTLSVELSVAWIDDPEGLGKVFLFLGISCPLNSFQAKTHDGTVFTAGAPETDLFLFFIAHYIIILFQNNLISTKYTAQTGSDIHSCTNLLMLRM